MTLYFQSYSFAADWDVEFETTEEAVLDKANPDRLQVCFCLWWWLKSKRLHTCKRFSLYFWLNPNAFMEFTTNGSWFCVSVAYRLYPHVCVLAFTCNNKQICSLKTWQYTDRMTVCLFSLSAWRTWTGNFVVLLTPCHVERCRQPSIHL